MNILVVDDSRTNLKLIGVVLVAKGHTVVSAMDAEAAISLIESHTFDLILMDIELPGMDGLTLTRKLKAESSTKNIPVIAITAFAMKGDEVRAMEAGCDGYITKPIATKTLMDDILNCLAGYKFRV